jgi:hypothetical protein
MCSGFKWTIDETLDSMQILTLSERYMFASKEGPILLPQGDSYIEAKAIVEFTSVASIPPQFPSSSLLCPQNEY